MNVSLTPKLEDYIRHKVASGLYNNASEVVREALRLLIAREGQDASKPRATTIEEIRAKLAALEKSLRKRGVTSLALFGSAARGEARPESDVDVLIDIDPNARFSLVDLAALKDSLEQQLGRDVDVVTRDGLDPAISDKVLAEAQPVF